MWVSWFVSEHDCFPLSEASFLKSSLIEVVYFNLKAIFPFKQTKHIVTTPVTFETSKSFDDFWF